MAEIVDTYKAVFDDSDVERFEKSLLSLGKTAENLEKQLEDALNPDVSGQFALGVTDGLNDLKKKYAELATASATLRTALRTATDPTAIKLYQKAVTDLDAGMKGLETTAKKAGVNLKEVNKEASVGKQVFNEFFGAFTKSALITVAIQKVIEFTKYAVELADQTRLAQKQFEAFLGSAEKAGQVVADLQGFAADKFLNTGEVLQAGKALLAFGENAESLQDVLARVADISGATGKNFNELVTIYGKARAAGVLYAEDTNQLVDAGIPIIQEFAKQMGVSNDAVKKLASEGKISFEELQLAFFNLTTEGGKFAGQAELNAFTIGGAWRGLLAELQPLIEGVGDFFSFAGQKILNTTKELVSDVKSLFGVANEEVGAFFDVPVQKEKAALDEQAKLEAAAAKRRQELAAQNDKKSQDAAEKRRKQRLEEFNRLLADVDAQAQALDIAQTFDPVARVQKEYAAAQKAALELEKNLIKLATTPEQKEAIKKSMAQLFDQLLLEYNENLSKAETELEKLKSGKIRDALNPLPPPEQISDDVKFRAKGTIELIKTSIQEAIDQAAEDEKPFNLADFLKISEDELKGVLSATDQIIESLGNLADARVKEAEAATKAADDKVKAAEDALEKEKELAADGLANNVDAATKELEKQKEIRDAALKEEAKARRAQILLDGASQLSSLITASANIFKTLSGIPFVGIPLAIATIALMFGAFGKAKADALKAASAPKFKHGGEARVTKDGILVGPSHDDGGIGIEAEGGEMVYSDGRKLSIVNKSATREHFDLLRAVNNDDKAAMVEHLAALTGGHRSDYRNPVIESAPHIARVEKEFREIRETQHTQALTEAYYAAAAKIVQAIEEKEVVTPLTNYKITKKSGRNTLTKVVREEK